VVQPVGQRKAVDMQHVQADSWELRFSVVVPVLNEQEKIKTIIEHLRSQDSNGGCEIIVVDGDPKGSTINLIQDKDVVTAVSEKGRAFQMNAGAALAHGEILLFLHADTRLPDSAFVKIWEVLQDDTYVGGAFDLGINSDRFGLKLIALRARLRCRRTRIPYGDQAIFLRRRYFEEIGCYKEIVFMEDVELMLRIKKRGDRIFIFRDRVKTSPRRWEKEGIIYTTVRNKIVANLYKLGVSPTKLAKYYRNHGEEADDMTGAKDK
jgi:rSAM/selenodomain-associated transferase 2